ncbi:MAG TPA: hypothetical protein VHV77_08660 [Pirellulales bacterium]|nr:hypothetical protein [Pirellulales bacterium]
MAWLQSIAEFVATHGVLWITTWAILGVITVALLVLMATRWGHSEPLHRCVVLSVWLHVLLAAYAASIHIVGSKPGAPQSFTVQIIAGDDDSDDDADPSEAIASDAVPSSNAIDEQLPEVEPAPKPEDVVADVMTTPPTIAPDEKLDTPESPPPPIEKSDAEPSMPIAGAEPPAPVETSPPAEAMPPAAATEPPEESAIVEPALDPPANAAQLAEPAAVATPEALAGPVDAPAPTNPPPVSETTVAEMTPKLLDEPQATLPLADLIPTQRPTPQLYAGRFAPDHTAQARQHGGSPETEAAVKAALAWLAQTQSKDGRWDASQFGSGQEPNVPGHNRRGAGAHADTGITGLALLAFLGAGHTHTRGDYRPTVARGLDFLLKTQASHGELGGEAEMFAFTYCHGMATLALSEAYAMSGDERLLKPVRDAISYTVNAQNRVLGGWRYRPGDAGDTSQLGWQLMALKSAEQGGIPISSATRQRMVRYLGSVSSGTYGGLASYRPSERPTRPMTAEALVCRQFLGLAEPSRNGAEASTFIVDELPGTTPMNLYYWYYATLGLYQEQGPAWDRWNAALVATLLGAQQKDGEPGSWNPDPVWGSYGGRVFSTALATMCLEVYYRYLPLYVEAARVDRSAR